MERFGASGLATHLRRFSVTNWRVGSVNPGCVGLHVGLVTISCPGPGGTPGLWLGLVAESTTAPMSPAPFDLNSRGVQYVAS